MSETDNPAAQAAETPQEAPQETPKGRQNAKGRGRGGKRKGTGKGKAAQKPAAKKTATTGRRGRLKQFNDARVQAVYERQRELKAQFNQVAHVLRPALLDLADRETEQLSEDPEYHKQNAYIAALQQTLLDRRNDIIQRIKRKLELDNILAAKVLEHDRYYIDETLKVWFPLVLHFLLSSQIIG
jgi:hypothetical protein